MRGSWLGHVTGAAALGFLALALLVPLAAILWRGVAPVDGAPLAGLAATLADPYYLGRLWFTTWQALLSTVLTVAVGLPTALLLARYRFAGRRLLTAAFSVPFVMPTVVAGMGFLALAGPRGVLGVDLRGTLVIVLAAHVFYNFAIVARLVSGFLEGVGPRLEQAAATLGAGAWRTLWRVTLPLALPATVASATLVFIFCFTSFGVILILAPQARFATLEVEQRPLQRGDEMRNHLDIRGDRSSILSRARPFAPIGGRRGPASPSPVRGLAETMRGRPMAAPVHPGAPGSSGLPPRRNRNHRR